MAQELKAHYHSRWIHCRPGFFLSVRVLSRLFRRLFLEALEQAFAKERLAFHGALADLAQPKAFRALNALSTLAPTAPLRKCEWVVYAKPPFGGPQRVVEYLGRYTHRVAISNQRLLNVDNDQVTFQYKQYRTEDRQKARQMTLSADEFIRRFLLHSLPPGFQRIRHYRRKSGKRIGLLASRRKLANLELCRKYLNAPPVEPPPAPGTKAALQAQLLEPVLRCPQCLVGVMVRIRFFASTTGPPGPENTS